jgi:hypothetical protein
MLISCLHTLQELFIKSRKNDGFVKSSSRKSRRKIIVGAIHELPLPVGRGDEIAA